MKLFCRKRQFLIWTVATLLAAVGFAELKACPPPPPPPAQLPDETAEAYGARLKALREAEIARGREYTRSAQAERWDRSPVIFVGRVLRVKTTKVEYYGSRPSALVRPVRWIRGRGSNRPFWIRYTGETSCGPIGGGDAVRGAPGEQFLVMVKPGRLSAENVIDSVGRANAFDPRIAEALGAP